MYKNHLKMVKDVELTQDHAKRHCQKRTVTEFLQIKTLGTRVSTKKWYRARWAKGKTGIGLDEHRATHT